MQVLQDDLNNLLARPEPGPVAAPVSGPPRGWEPSLEIDRQAGTARFSSPASMAEASEADLLGQYGLDPEEWMVTKVTFTRDQNWTRAVRRPGSAGADGTELAALREQIEIMPPAVLDLIAPPRHGGRTFVVALADWQMGKGERGGSAGTVQRIQASIDAAARRLEELHSVGRKPAQIALVGLGDLVEGCTGFYAMQEFQVDLNRREQANVVRRLLLRAVRRFAEYGLPLVVATAAGNHGENRRKGKAFTTFGDNDDIAVFEQVADIVAEAPEAFGTPTFVIPGDDLSVTLELSGTRVAAVHGHQFGNGSTATAKALGWWQKQALGDQPVGAAQILLSGHLHHFTCSPHGARTHFQAPSLDGGSQWYREVAGVDSPPGLLTLMVGEACGPLGWSDLALL